MPALSTGTLARRRTAGVSTVCLSGDAMLVLILDSYAISDLIIPTSVNVMSIVSGSLDTQHSQIANEERLSGAPLLPSPVSLHPQCHCGCQSEAERGLVEEAGEVISHVGLTVTLK